MPLVRLAGRAALLPLPSTRCLLFSYSAAALLVAEAVKFNCERSAQDYERNDVSLSFSPLFARSLTRTLYYFSGVHR